MKILDEIPVDLNLCPGDRIHLLYTNEDGLTTEVLMKEIDKVMSIDTGIVFELEDGDLGMELGIGGAFGKKKVYNA